MLRYEKNALLLLGLFEEKGFYKIGYFEFSQVITRFSNPDVPNRNWVFVADTDDNTTLRCTIQFGENQAGYIKGLLEHANLLNGVLSRRRIKHQKDFMGGAFFSFADQGHISGTGLAPAKTMGSLAIVFTHSGFIVPGPGFE